VDTIPIRWQWLLGFNPFAVIISMYRSTLIEGNAPQLLPFILLSIFNIVVFLFGYAWFSRTKKGFADIL
jgi:lipopolysaccharide transport system permease protein